MWSTPRVANGLLPSMDFFHVETQAAQAETCDHKAKDEQNPNKQSFAKNHLNLLSRVMRYG